MLEAAAADVVELTRDLPRRLRAAMVAMACLMLCLMLGGAWIAAEVWNTSWRVPVLATMLGILACAAAVAGYHASRPSVPGHEPFHRLRLELDRERTLPQDASRFPRSRMVRAVLGASGLAGWLFR